MQHRFRQLLSLPSPLSKHRQRFACFCVQSRVLTSSSTSVLQVQLTHVFIDIEVTLWDRAMCRVIIELDADAPAAAVRHLRALFAHNRIDGHHFFTYNTPHLLSTHGLDDFGHPNIEYGARNLRVGDFGYYLEESGRATLAVFAETEACGSSLKLGRVIKGMTAVRAVEKLCYVHKSGILPS